MNPAFNQDKPEFGILVLNNNKLQLSDAPHKNYCKLRCSAALTLSHIEYL